MNYGTESGGLILVLAVQYAYCILPLPPKGSATFDFSAVVISLRRVLHIETGKLSVEISR